MVDNRGVTPISGLFQAENASANRMSDEKQGQGGEYFAQKMEQEETKQFNTTSYQDRSAQLRASLDSLAMMNAGSVNFNKLKDRKIKDNKNKLKRIFEEEIEESIFDE